MKHTRIPRWRVAAGPLCAARSTRRENASMLPVLAVVLYSWLGPCACVTSIFCICICICAHKGWAHARTQRFPGGCASDPNGELGANPNQLNCILLSAMQSCAIMESLMSRLKLLLQLGARRWRQAQSTVYNARRHPRRGLNCIDNSRVRVEPGGSRRSVVASDAIEQAQCLGHADEQK